MTSAKEDSLNLGCEMCKRNMKYNFIVLYWICFINSIHYFPLLSVIFMCLWSILVNKFVKMLWEIILFYFIYFNLHYFLLLSFIFMCLWSILVLYQQVCKDIMRNSLFYLSITLGNIRRETDKSNSAKAFNVRNAAINFLEKYAGLIHIKKITKTKQTNKNKQTNKQASKQASKQANKQTNKQKHIL